MVDVGGVERVAVFGSVEEADDEGPGALALRKNVRAGRRASVETYNCRGCRILDGNRIDFGAV
jgi:hypothetical protein